MPSEYQSADTSTRLRCPDLVDDIGEDPARYLDHDLTHQPMTKLVADVDDRGFDCVVPVPDDAVSSATCLPLTRIESIDYLDVIDAWLDVECERLPARREECPRPAIVAALNARKQWLREHGERPRGDRIDPSTIESTASVVTWDTPDGEQRTGAGVRR